MRKVVIFGDSNTFGRIPGTSDGRYPYEKRWTTLLQNMLGDDWTVSPEGFPGRTILSLESDPADKDGPRSFLPVLERNAPFDYLLIMLGSNDFKTRFHVTPEMAVEGMRYYIDSWRQFTDGMKSELIILSPPVFQPYIPEKAAYFENATEKMTRFNTLLRELTGKDNVLFLDTSYAKVDRADGIHLSPESQKIIAILVRDLLLHHDRRV